MTLQLATVDVAVADYLEEVIVFVQFCSLCFAATRTPADVDAVKAFLAIPKATTAALGLLCFFSFHPAAPVAMVVDAAAPAAKRCRLLRESAFLIKTGTRY